MSDKKSGKNSKQNTEISDDDMALFRDQLSDVRPLSSEKRVEPVKIQHAPRPRKSNNLSEDNNQFENPLMSDPVDLREIDVEDVLFFARSGIQQKVQKKLRRGEFPVEEELDLHGYTVVEAKAAIQNFFRECKKFQKRYIRIIHGKGYRSEQKIPVLKSHVAHWLPQHPDVMAFSSALAKDGGTGALYVILKVVR